MELAQRAADWFAGALTDAHGAIEVVGPAPCPIERIKQRWRWHLLLRTKKSAALTRVSHRFLTTFVVPARGSLRVTYDRDPVALL